MATGMQNPVLFKKPKNYPDSIDKDSRSKLTKARMRLMTATLRMPWDGKEDKQAWLKRMAKKAGISHLQADRFLNCAFNNLDV